MRILLILIAISVSLYSCTENQQTQLKKKYIKDLKLWVKSGSRNQNDIRTQVIEPCGKLVMLLATAKEKADYISRSQIKEFDLRVSFCMSAVISKVWPNQPGFDEFQKKACRENIPLVKLVCKEFI